MSGRSVIAGIALAVASVPALAGVSSAQDLDCRHFRFQEDAQAEFNRDPSDPHRLDEDQGPDDGLACEVLPSRTGGVQPAVPSPTDVPSVSPSAPAQQPANPLMPTRGTRGGIGGTSGPGDLATGIGFALATGAAAASCFLVGRRLRRRAD
ncbi:excalibur calcium-binding protein [Streptomyces sp. NPDC126503]|uniref:excalibur calcium-binding protein n=1 Tax=Streptomyces sp. NPDC126503 TaxID=3155315 RepID=UPI0033289497